MKGIGALVVLLVCVSNVWSFGPIYTVIANSPTLQNLYSFNSSQFNLTLNPVDYPSTNNVPFVTPSYHSKDIYLWADFTGAAQLGILSNLDTPKPTISYSNWHFIPYVNVAGFYEFNSDLILLIYYQNSQTYDWRLSLIHKTSGKIQYSFYFQNASTQPLHLSDISQHTFNFHTGQLTLLFHQSSSSSSLTLLTLQVSSSSTSLKYSPISSNFNFFFLKNFLQIDFNLRDGQIYGVISETSGLKNLIGFGIFDEKIGKWSTKVRIEVDKKVYSSDIYYSYRDDSFYFSIGAAEVRMGRFDVRKGVLEVSGEIGYVKGLHCGEVGWGICSLAYFFDNHLL